MVKNYKEQVKLIKSCKQINDKLMVLALYNEFYKYFDANAKSQDKEAYLDLMDKTFSFLIESAKLNSKLKIGAEDFMTSYLETLECVELTTVPEANEIVSDFKKFIPNIAKTSEYVRVIDKYDNFPLRGKVEIMTTFRDILNGYQTRCFELFGEDNSFELRHDMTKFLTRKLDKFIEGRVNHHTNYPTVVKEMDTQLSIKLKSFFLEQVKDEKLRFEMVDKYDRETLKDFTDEDLKALSLDLSYYIMGSSPELFERAHDISVVTGLEMSDSFNLLFDSHRKVSNIVKEAIKQEEVNVYKKQKA